MGASFVPSVPEDVGAEAALGNPASDGFILVSTAAGVRAWANKGVTNGDSHNHVDGDGALIPVAGVESAAWTAWTPIISAHTGAYASASGTGRYIKIGTLVHFIVTVTVTSKGNGGSPLFTLPVTPVAVTMGIVGHAKNTNRTGAAAQVDIVDATGAKGRLTALDGTVIVLVDGDTFSATGFYETAV